MQENCLSEKDNRRHEIETKQKGQTELMMSLLLLGVLLLWTVPASSQLQSGRIPSEAELGSSNVSPRVDAAPRLPKLEDALAMKRIDAISIIPNGKLLAIETEGGILILSTGNPVTRIRTLKGNQPRWSPDGRTLGFYAEVNGLRQIEAWYPQSDAIEQITEFPDGISSGLIPGGLGQSDLFAWSPDSLRIAFCSREMVGYKSLGKADSSKARVFRAVDAPSLGELDGVFRVNYLDYIGDAERTRAIERHPELGLNKLFVVDIETKRLHQITKNNRHWSPAWSPDGLTLAAVVELDNVETADVPTNTNLVLIDINTGEERRVPAAFPIIGALQWSKDGTKIAAFCKERYFSFNHIQLYSARNSQWSEVSAPKGTSVNGFRWASDNRSLMVRTSDRFVDTLWLIDSVDGSAHQVDTNDLNLSYRDDGIDQDANGDIYFVAGAATFAGRVFQLSAGTGQSLRQLYDVNPQLSELRFAQQKRLTWTNKAGDQVDGVLIFPANYRPNQRYPVIVDVYPRQVRDELYLAYGGMGQLEAAAGYLVFLPQLRAPNVIRAYKGDENYNERARGAKGIPLLVDDFSSGVEYLVRQGWADPDRIGIFGHSNGGYVANYLITETKIPKCAVVGSGRSNLIFDWYFYPDVRWWVDQIRASTGDIYDKDAFEEFVQMSPVLRMNKVQIPVLMFVGDEDLSWLPEMLMEFNALRQLGKDVTMVRYANEGHVFTAPEDIRDFRARVDAFFDQHLRPGQSTGR